MPRLAAGVCLAGVLAFGACSPPTAPQRLLAPVDRPAPSEPLPAGSAVFVPAPTGTPPAGRPEEGSYTLAVELGPLVGPSCDAVPDEARTRRYAATVTFVPFRGLQVDLSDATFLQGPVCDEPRLCNRVMFEYDDFRDGYLWLAFLAGDAIVVEQLGSGAWLQLSGWPYGRYDSDVSALTGAMTLRYWSGEPVGSSYAQCEAGDARVTMTRRQ